MSEWKEYKLGEVAEIKNGKSRPKVSGKIPVYGGNGILDFCAKSNVNGKTIIIGRVGAYCGSVYFEDKEIWISDNALYAKSNKGFDSKFLYYLLKHDNLNQYAGGSSHPLLTQGRLNDLKYKLPSLPTQTAIAEILSSLDDKIELNNQINKDLEALAQALFKQWFIDFEFPNENGEPYKSSGGEMVDSELGEIPKGWNVAWISDVTELVTKGTTPTSIGGKFSNSGINFIKVESLTEAGGFIKSKFGFIDEETNLLLKRSIIKEGDVLFSIAGTIGRVAIVPKSILPANTNQAIAIIRPSKVDSFFLKLLMQSSLIQNDTQANIVQAVQANLSLGVIKSTKFILPSNKVLAIFKMITCSMYEQIDELTCEIEELTNLRDTLLPKLISGELEVSDIQSNTL